jgi:hypothetical protein
VTDFSAEWLALREPADHLARSRRVSQAIADVLRDAQVVRAVDLAAGTGSNVRFLAPILPLPQEWLLVDRDPALLTQVHPIDAVDMHTRIFDLSAVAELAELFALQNLITTSALLDLVSDDWLSALCGCCREQRVNVLFGLSYDGRIACSPADPEDVLVRGLVNRHQRTDKGFGPALGPDAADRAVHHLESRGYQVIRDRSDWVLEPESRELQRQLIEGWAAAAIAIRPVEVRTISAWLDRRMAHLDQGRSRLIVGHEDLGAFIA